MTNSLIRLEFGKVLENIAVRTSSNAGNRKVMALAPEWNPEAAEKRKLETIAAAELLASGIRIPAGIAVRTFHNCSLYYEINLKSKGLKF